MSANTISSRSYRDKYRLSTWDNALRNRLVAEKVCMVDRSDVLRIQSPYGSAPTTVVQALSGTYTPAAFTLTDDTLTVTDEFIVSEQVYDYEQILTNFDLFSKRVDEQTYSVATKIDAYVINSLTNDGTGTYSTPVGGFTTVANVNVIMANLISKVAGYADMYNGLFLVIENTDIVGFVQSQATNGFNYADAALNNGFMASYMGVDIFVVRSGTYVSATIGTRTFTNAGHRVFGVKNVATYAAPRGVQFDEKAISGKTGKEIVAWGYIGFKLWTPKAPLVVNITLL